MATSSSTLTPNPGSSKLKLTPLFPKHVFLYDWWLIKADTHSDGRVLGIGGLSSKEQLGIRVLHSAAIVKRHNTNTVETADGLTITFSGSINKLRTFQNGFPDEVCNQFIFGFPYHWEEFSSESFAKETTSRAVDESTDEANFLLKSFDNLPCALLRDCFVSKIVSCESGKLKSIFKDMLQTYGGDSLNQRAELISSSKEISQVTRDCGEDKTCNDKKQMNVEQKQKDEDDISGAKARKQKFQKVARELGIGPSTRSMSRSKVASNKPEEEILLSSTEKSHIIKSSPLSEASAKQHQGSVTGRNVSSVCSTTRILSLRNRSIDFHSKGRRLTLRNRSIDFRIKG